MKPARLVKTEKYFFVVFKTQEDALEAYRIDHLPALLRQDNHYHTSSVNALAIVAPVVASLAANHWTEKFKRQVWVARPGDVFLILKRPKKVGLKLRKVLHGNRVGWIIVDEWIRWEKVE